MFNKNKLKKDLTLLLNTHFEDWVDKVDEEIGIDFLRVDSVTAFSDYVRGLLYQCYHDQLGLHSDICEDAFRPKAKRKYTKKIKVKAIKNNKEIDLTFDVKPKKKAGRPRKVKNV